MSDMDHGSKPLWSRSSMVCTSCRQSKTRCDYQDKFPEPCSRCASQPDKKAACHVDPNFKRVTKRSNKRAEATPAANSASPASSSSFRGSSPNVSLPTPSSSSGGPHESPPAGVPAEDSATPVYFPEGPDRTLMNIHMSGAEISLCFVEFFTRYHPVIPLLSQPADPVEIFNRNQLFFWTVVTVSTTPYPEHPIPRARVPDLHLQLHAEVKVLVSQLMIKPGRDHLEIGALLLLSEYPQPTPVKRNLSMIYANMAITLGHFLGLHRPHYFSEFEMKNKFDTGQDMGAFLRERTLVWLQTFIIHNSLSSHEGLPPLLGDDYVFSEASWPAPIRTSPSHNFLASLPPYVSKLVRIHRFVAKFIAVLHRNPASPTGSQSGTSRNESFTRLYNQEFTDLERELEPMGNLVSIHFFQAKLHLNVTSLQGEDDCQEPDVENVYACYTSAICILRSLAELAKNENTRFFTWTTNFVLALFASVLTLLKLEAVISVHPKLSTIISREVLLQEISVAYNLMGDYYLQGDVVSRGRQIMAYLSRDISRRLSDKNYVLSEEERRTPKGKARPGLGNLLYDAIRRAIFKPREKSPLIEPEMQEQEAYRDEVWNKTYGLSDNDCNDSMPATQAATSAQSQNDVEANFENWLAGLTPEECQVVMSELGAYQQMNVDYSLQPEMMMTGGPMAVSYEM